MHENVTRNINVFFSSNCTFLLELSPLRNKLQLCKANKAQKRRPRNIFRSAKIFSEIPTFFHKCQNVFRNTKLFSDIPKYFQKCLNVFRKTKTFLEMPKCFQKYQHIFRNALMLSEIPKYKPFSSEIPKCISKNHLPSIFPQR